uniref:GST N-terminal domain-containing protein n=1 Tax=Panagrolaimus davidi TaxID=227884 RepID=A0A914PGW7_9BILA
MSVIEIFGINDKSIADPVVKLLKYLNVDYQDMRMPLEDWMAREPDTKAGKLPYLQYDGHKIVGGVNMCRFLGRKYNLAGKDDYEAADIDGCIDLYFEFSYGVATGTVHQVLDRNLPIYSNFLEESKSGFMVRSGVSWADFIISEYLIGLQKVNSNVFDGHDDIKEYIERVTNDIDRKKFEKKKKRVEDLCSGIGAKQLGGSSGGRGGSGGSSGGRGGSGGSSGGPTIEEVD